VVTQLVFFYFFLFIFLFQELQLNTSTHASMTTLGVFTSCHLKTIEKLAPKFRDLCKTFNHSKSTFPT